MKEETGLGNDTEFDLGRSLSCSRGVRRRRCPEKKSNLSFITGGRGLGYDGQMDKVCLGTKNGI